jgi:hypothetical protein
MTTLIRFRIATVLVTLFLVAACAPVKVHNVVDAPVVINTDSVTLEQVRDAVIRAGASLGWIMVKQQPGVVRGTLRLRTHVAIVDVSFDTSSYSIEYVDSTNLDYSEEKGTIHKNYNGCIQNLDNAIQRELAVLM